MPRTFRLDKRKSEPQKSSSILQVKLELDDSTSLIPQGRLQSQIYTIVQN